MFLHKMIDAYKQKIDERKKDFPRDLKYYQSNFEMNSWTVDKSSGSVNHALRIYFEGTMVAVAHRDYDTEKSRYMIGKIDILQGFEELKPLVYKVIKAAAQAKISEEQDEMNKRKNLAIKAKRETKWLGPY